MLFYLMGTVGESVAGFIALLPILVLFHIIISKKSNKENIKAPIGHIIGTYIFSFLLLAILSVTGVPEIYNLTVDLHFNLTLFLGKAPDIQYILNIMLFVPLGFLLPLLWEKYEKWILTFLTGMLLSLAIEISQIFCYRATDIDDLLMNTLGTVIGYLIFILIKRIFPQVSILSIKKNTKYWIFEPYFIFAFSWAVMFFVQPLIASWLWSLTGYMVRM